MKLRSGGLHVSEQMLCWCWYIAMRRNVLYNTRSLRTNNSDKPFPNDVKECGSNRGHFRWTNSMQKRSQNVYHCGMPRRASHLFSLDLSSSSSSFFPAVNYPGSLSQWSKTFLTTSPIGDTIPSEVLIFWFLPIEPSDHGSKSIPYHSDNQKLIRQ